MILGWTLCGDGGDGHLRVCGVRVGDLGEAAFGEDVQADVAAQLGPFVVLFGEHGADQADQGGPVGKDADDVGAAADLAVQPFLGVVGPDLAPDGFGEAVKAKMSARAASRCSATAGSLSTRASRIRSNWACTASASGWS